MTLWEYIGLAVLVVFVLLIVSVAVRRQLLARSGGVDLCWRVDRGWVLGQARFSGEELRLYRSLSFLPFAAKVLHRQSLTLGQQREQEGTEPDLLPRGAVILRCTYDGRPWEIALDPTALTGLRSWLESAPSDSGRMHPGR